MPATTSFVSYPANSQTAICTVINSQLESALISAGWVFVEEVIYTSFTARVFKTGTGVAGGGKICVSLERPTVGTGALLAHVGEDWDAVNKKLLYPIQSQSGVGNTLQSSDWSGSLSAGGFVLSSTFAVMPSLSGGALANATSYDVFCYADKSWFSLQVTQTGTASLVNSWLVGLCEPFYSDSPATFPPLVCWDLSTAYRARSVRGFVGSSVVQWSSCLLYAESVPLGGLSINGPMPDTLTNKIRPCRLLISGLYPTSSISGVVPGRTVSATIGASTTMGLFPGLCILESLDSPRAGDFFTLDGIIYTRIGRSLPLTNSYQGGIYIPAGHSW